MTPRRADDSGRRGGLAARRAAGRARDAAQRRAAARALAPLHPLRAGSHGQRLPRPSRTRRRAPAAGAPGARTRPRRPGRARRPPPPGGARPGGAGRAHGLAAARRPQHDLEPGAAGRAGRRGARGGGHLRGALLRDLGVRRGPGCPDRARRVRCRPGVLRGRRDRAAGGAAQGARDPVQPGAGPRDGLGPATSTRRAARPWSGGARRPACRCRCGSAARRSVSS